MNDGETRSTAYRGDMTDALAATSPVSVPRAVAILAVLPLLAVVLWMPIELQWPSVFHPPAALAILLLILLYPGLVGLMAVRSPRPEVVIVVGALLFAVPVSISVSWVAVSEVLQGRAPYLPLGNVLPVVVTALAALVGGAVATRDIERGHPLTGFILGAAVEVAILSVIVVSAVLMF